MKNVLIALWCLLALNLSAQSYLGFSPQNCIQPMTNVYTYANGNSGTGSGYYWGFGVYRNGTMVYQEGGYMGSGSKCHDMVFVNDSTGFLMTHTGSGGIKVLKTKDYGATWNLIGNGLPAYYGLYVANVNVAYLITGYTAINVTRCSDIMPPYNIIDSNLVNADIYVTDTILNHTLCNNDSLRISFINGNSDTIRFHINEHFGINNQQTNFSVCSGNAINIPYEIDAIFNPGNIFTAELSDASGNFSSPVSIGSLMSVSSGTLNAIIPANTSSGNLYHIRIISSNPPYISKSNGAYISISNGTPIMGITGTDSICVGDIVSLVGSGANTYTWSTGITVPAITFTPLVSCSYTLSGENICGVSSEVRNIIVDSTCTDVWPGDANGDGFANNLDILELGLHFNHTGSPRAVISNNWQSYFANTWNGTITNGENLCNSDCNGDGIINNDDTVAISNNCVYSFPLLPNPNSRLKINANQTHVLKGTWRSASIYLGDSLNQFNNVNGVAFSVEFPISFGSDIRGFDSIYVDYNNSFLNPTNQNLNFQKVINSTDIYHNLFHTASTHTNNINSSGFGKIATIYFKLVSNYVSEGIIGFELKASYISDANGVITRLGVSDCQIFEGDPYSGIQEFLSTDNVFTMSPNPTQSSVLITSIALMQKIVVTNITGQVLISEPVNEKSHQLQLQNFAEGIYFLKVCYANGQSVIKKVIKQ